MLFIIDFEFTGLDSEYIREHEIMETKIGICNDKFELISRHCWTHKTNRENSIGSFLVNGITKDMQTSDVFSNKWFNETLTELGVIKQNNSDRKTKIKLFGFGIKQDKVMLKKYNVDVSEIVYTDIQELLGLSEEHEQDMVENGRSLETCHAIVTGNPSQCDHHGTDELDWISDIGQEILRVKPLKEHYKFMPWGRFRGMPLSDYVSKNRRAADGYRYNNNDVLANSMNHEIASMFEY